jgi:hypothetical protein
MRSAKLLILFVRGVFVEKLKRKLSLLNVPVYEIQEDSELTNVLYQHLDQLGEDLVSTPLKLYFGTHNVDAATSDNQLNVIVFQTLLAVEESSILFVDKGVNDNINLLNVSHYSALIVQERNIVDSIEVALHRISSASGYYNNYMEIISPDSIPSNSIIIIKKD